MNARHSPVSHFAFLYHSCCVLPPIIRKNPLMFKCPPTTQQNHSRTQSSQPQQAHNTRFTISGTLTLQGVRATRRSCPFKPNPLGSGAVVISWGAHADKSFWVSQVVQVCKPACNLAVYPKMYTAALVFNTNQNVRSRARKMILQQTRPASGDFEQRGWKGGRLYRKKITSLCPWFSRLYFAVAVERGEEIVERLSRGKRFITAGQV